MKNLIMKSLIVALAITAVAAFTPSAFAQASATASASANATIVPGLTLTKTADLNFGNIVQDATGGTVSVPTSGAETSTGPVLLGVANAAAFDVTGDGNRTFSVTLPASPLSISDGVASTMTVNNFKDSCGGTCTLATGAQSFTVGADLIVGASQTIGSYTGSFNVTVAYN
ncbi:MAG: DUF4402 domain-containing protein [Thermoanaerobaculia bacterium]